MLLDFNDISTSVENVKVTIQEDKLRQLLRETEDFLDKNGNESGFSRVILDCPLFTADKFPESENYFSLLDVEHGGLFRFVFRREREHFTSSWLFTDTWKPIYDIVF